MASLNKENLVKFGHAVSEISEQMDRQTDKQLCPSQCFAPKVRKRQ